MEQRKGTSMECPFCGHHGDLVAPESFSDQRGETLWCIHCKHCLADGPVEMSLDSAVREWKLRYVPWERDLKRALELAERYIVGTINGDTFSTDSEDLAWVIAKLNEAEESSPSNPGLQGTGHLVDRTLQNIVQNPNRKAAESEYMAQWTPPRDKPVRA